MASQSNPYEFFSEMMKNKTVDREQMISNHRKNIEALTQATKVASEMMRSVTQLQQQYIKQAFESMSSMMKDTMNQDKTQDRLKQHADTLKNRMNQSLEHGVTVSSMISKSQKQIYDMMKDHVNHNMESFRQKNKSH